MTIKAPNQEVLFARENVERISQRSAVYILQRNMEPSEAWKQAIEDEAELIEFKLQLMDEGILVWEWPAEQLAAMRRELAHQAEHQEVVAT